MNTRWARNAAWAVVLLTAAAGCSHKKEDCALFEDEFREDPALDEPSNLVWDEKKGAIAIERSTCEPRDPEKARQAQLRDGEAIVLFKRYLGTKKDVCKSRSHKPDLDAVKAEMNTYCGAD